MKVYQPAVDFFEQIRGNQNGKDDNKKRVQAIKDDFEALDKNDDGVLDATEIREYLEAENSDRVVLDYEVSAIFKASD